jgi:hypothetical protein
VDRGFEIGAVPVFAYAAVFVLVNLAYIPFEWHALAWAPVEEISPRTRRFAKTRSLFTLGTFFIAMLVSLKFPLLGFGLICCALLVYLRPEPLGPGNRPQTSLSGGGRDRRKVSRTRDQTAH